MSNILKPEDYIEKKCLLDMKTDNVTPIDTRRFIEKLDEHLGRNDYVSAERHLIYWLGEAKNGNDLRGEFSVANEMMGLYRKLGREKDAFAAVENTLSIMKAIGLQNETAGGTAYVNIATVYKAFGKADKALPYFEKARAVYEKLLPPTDTRLGGLYNNMALALADLKEYEAALKLYEKAISIMMKNENGEQDAAISYLNMANVREAQFSAEEAEPYISAYIEKAKELLDSPTLLRNGYHAFVCEKCAPTFEYYGYFLYANELKERSNRIYEGN